MTLYRPSLFISQLVSIILFLEIQHISISLTSSFRSLLVVSEVYFSIGTNFGKRIENLIDAVKGLEKIIQNIKISYVYETEPWGYERQKSFLNICVFGLTDLKPQSLLNKIKLLEVEIGRKETFKWGPRKIDIDLLFMDDLIIDKDELTIPHEGIEDRAFVLVPFMDINPSFKHPILQKKIHELTSEIGSNGVKKFEIQPFLSPL